MAERDISQFTKATKSDVTSNWLLYWGDANNKGSDIGDRAMEKDDFEDYVSDIVNADSWISKTTVNGANDLIALGAVASYEGFKVEFIFKNGTNVLVGDLLFRYQDSDAKDPTINLNGDIPVDYSISSGFLTIEQAIESSGQFYWRVSNRLGSDVSFKYKVTQFPAI